MKNILRWVLVLGSVGFGSFRAGAATWYVSPTGSDAAAGTNWVTAKQTIQAAVDAASSNDTVLVTNGLYATGGRTIAAAGATTNRVVIDKAITVTSVNGPANTTIKGFWDPTDILTNGIGPAAVRGVYLGTNAVLSGFTVTNGATRALEYVGGGIHSENSGVVSNCVISGNSSDWGGGGVYGGTVRRSVISGNRAGDSYGGGGLCNANAYDCLIISNTSRGEGGYYYTGSAAVWLSFAPNPPAQITLANCTIVKNTSAAVGLLLSSSGYVVEVGLTNRFLVRNCVMWDNVNDNIEDIAIGDCRNNCYRFSKGSNSITNNPQFVDSMSGNYQLKWTSPCRNAGSTNYVASATDLLGLTRIVGTNVDIGAYEAVDSDGDQLSNGEEAYYGTNPLLTDTDGDGLADDQEVYVHFTNPLLTDSDSDGFADGFEVANGYSPTNSQLVLVNYIRTNGTPFGLYTTNPLQDVAVGQMGLNITGTNAALSLQLQQSADLGNSWSNAGTAVPWTLPVGADKKFLRVRASP